MEHSRRARAGSAFPRDFRGLMATAAAKKPKDTPRQALCRELLEIRAENAAVFTRIDAINTKLKSIAGTGGKFRETFDELGYVSVSPAKPEQVIGTEPVLKVDFFNGLPESRRKTLIAQGLIAIASLIKGASYGQVRVKLHNEPEGDDE